MPAAQPHELYLLSLLAAAVHQAAPPEPPPHLDWSALLVLAREHSVPNLAYEAVSRLEPAHRPPAAIFSRLRQDFQLFLAKDACQQYEGEQIFRQLAGQQITFMPLKGWLMKPLYPRSDLRTMADIDILYDPARTEDVRRILRDLGYREQLYGGNQDVYTKWPYLNVEMHRSLLPEDAGGFAFFASMIRQAERQGYQLSLNPVDCYLYLLAHLIKHCQSAGTGIRSILDISVYRHHYRRQLDPAILRPALAQIGLASLASQIETLAEAWFAGPDEVTEPASDPLPGPLPGSLPGAGGWSRSAATVQGQSAWLADPQSAAALLGLYIIRNGTYGRLNNLVLASLFKQKQGITSLSPARLNGWKLQHLRQRILPSRQIMAAQFPVIRRRPWLLPVCWALRISRSLSQRPRQLRTELRYLGQLTPEQLEFSRALQEKTGLYGNR